MRRCPHCNDWVAIRAARCPWCSKPLAPEPARPTSAESAITDLVGALAKRWERTLTEGSGATRDAIDCGRTLQLRECCDELRAELGKIQNDPSSATKAV